MSLFVYGVHPVEEALRRAPHLVTTLYVRKEKKNPHISLEIMAEEKGITIKSIRGEELDTLSKGGNHQGVAIDLTAFPYRGLSDLLDWTRDSENALLVILDGVEDPQNFGAIIRNAAAFGASGIIIAKNRAVNVTPQVIRSSAGLAFGVSIVRVTNISRTINELAEYGWWSLCGIMDAPPIWTLDLQRKIALVVGGEGGGVRRLVQETCDLSAAIPMATGVESMNVASASSVLMYEWKRQNSIFSPN